MKIEFIHSDERSGIAWYEVNGESWGLTIDEDEQRLIDPDGCPVLDCNDHDRIKDLLIEFSESSEQESE